MHKAATYLRFKCRGSRNLFSLYPSYKEFLRTYGVRSTIRVYR